MKSYSALIVVLVFSLLSAQVKLEIKVEALESAEGNILLELLDENENTLKAIVQKIDSLPCIVEINDIENGTYGIKYFHDRNANGKIDFNWMGIPTEGFGFSNNAYGLFKPKKFTAWLFDVSQDTMIYLTPKYLNFP